MVLLSIWATWCTPCVKEMPSLDGLQAKFGADRLIVLPIIEDREGLTAARTFYDRHQLTHLPVLADTAGHAPAALHVRGLPTTLLLGPDGRELARVEGGADWLSPEAVAFLQAQMKPR
jgi:thiol-disulfide isomerase/thioredoxin